MGFDAQRRGKRLPAHADARRFNKDCRRLEIDADAGTVTVLLPGEDLRTLGARQVETTKAELVATILAMQSRELMAMSKQELMARQLVMLEK